VGPVCYNASSNPGDGVLDPFCSCETATEATQRFGCRWVAFRGAVRHRAALWNKAQRHQGYYWCSNRRKLSTIEKNGAGEIAAAATLPAPVSRVVPAVADLSSMVTLTGLEPVTSSSGGWRSIQLSYRATSDATDSNIATGACQGRLRRWRAMSKSFPGGAQRVLRHGNG
jgi:hypothetical protein